MNKKSLWKLILILAIPCIIGFMPAPAGLSELAWVLFGIYLAAIVGLVIKPFPEPVVLLIAVAASMVVVGNLSDGAFKTLRRTVNVNRAGTVVLQLLWRNGYSLWRRGRSGHLWRGL